MAGQGPPLPGVTPAHRRSAKAARALPAGETGALEVAGYVTPGYCGASAEHNEAAFTGDGYFRTGDLGFVDEAGGFHFVARDADIIKRAGINVSPAEIESLLLRIRPSPRPRWSAPLPASGARRSSPSSCRTRPAEITGEALRAHCRALASSYKVPDHIEIRAALPVTETGKLFRRALRDEARRR